MFDKLNEEGRNREGDAGWILQGYVHHNSEPRDTVKTSMSYKCSIWYQDI